MPPTGEGKRKVLVVAEAPGINEDLQGEQLVGDSGEVFRRALDDIGIDLDLDCWKTNSIICHPPGNAKPTEKQLQWCRPNLINALNELRPEIIITLGKFGIRQVLGPEWKEETTQVGRWIGWRIPHQTLNIWICPTYHPSYVMREYERGNVAPALWMRRHLESAFQLLGRPWRTIPNYETQIRIIQNPQKAAAEIESFVIQGNPVAFDYETTTLKPDGPEAEIICCSVSDGEVSIAYPWISDAVAATKKMLVSDLPKIGWNCRFESRWTMAKLGCRVKNWIFDGMLGAHVADNRKGITGLKFQSFVRLGQPKYNQHIENAFKSDNSNKANRAKDLLDPVDLLRYCGMDSLLEFKVSKLIMEELGYA